MIDNLKIGSTRPQAMLLDKPSLADKYEFDFSQPQWVLNPDNMEGITVDKGRLVITKVKPNVWFLKSNYGFSSDEQRNEMFLDKLFNVQGLSANSDDITPVAINGYNAYGLVVSPCSEGGGFMSSDYPWDMGIPGGSFKFGPQGATNYGYTADGKRALYNYPVGTKAVPWWSGPYWEIGFAFFTNVPPDDGEYFTLRTPLIIESDNQNVFDPTTIEAWEVAIGNQILYQKDKTFDNCLMEYKLAFKCVGNYIDDIQGISTISNKSNWQLKHPELGDENIAFVVTDKEYADQYEKISIPVPTDLRALIEDGKPIKFWASHLVDIPERKGLWESVKEIFKEVKITDSTFAENLFSKSNIDSVELTLSGTTSHLFSIDGCFDWSSVESVKINVEDVRLSSIRNAFRQTRNLKKVEFVNAGDFEDSLGVAQYAGAFEYSSLPEFPANLGIENTEGNHQYSDGVCGISYAFHQAMMPVVGNYKNANTQERWYCLVDPTCQYAFDGWQGHTILWDLDMKFVNPNDPASAFILNCENLTSARIQGLNKGNWNLDGVNRGILHGNLVNLDEESLNYMLEHIFDLRLNENEDTSLTETTHGLSSASLYLPEGLKEKAKKESLVEAIDRGWDIYFGGELAEVAEEITGSTAETSDIVFANKNTNELKIVRNDSWNLDKYPKDTWEPIGVVVIPGSHDVYGTGECGVMSLKPMDCDTPVSGGTSEQCMHWGVYGTDIPELPNLNRVPRCGTAASPTEDLTSESSSCYLPSTSFSNGEVCPHDKNAKYYSTSSSYYPAPSPYLTDGSRNPSYFQKTSPTSAANCLADFDGRGNSDVLLKIRGEKDYNSWKPAYDASEDYPAVSCCDMYKTEGTEQEDWYLPSEGELGYLVARFKEINSVISKIIQVYGSSYAVAVISEIFWSSSEHNNNYARSVDTSNGNVDIYTKNHNNYVRAFLRL